MYNKIEPRHEETCLCYMRTTGADQPAQISLISAFVVHCLHNINIYLLNPKLEDWLVHVAEQAHGRKPRRRDVALIEKQNCLVNAKILSASELILKAKLHVNSHKQFAVFLFKLENVNNESSRMFEADLGYCRLN